MTIADDIKNKAKSTFKEAWSIREGRTVPDYTTVKQNNDAVHFDRATVLYADLDSSTNLVDSNSWGFAGEVYKTFLYAAARIIRDEGGAITSYDGDRVMAVFLGDSQCTSAARAGLKIHYAVKYIVQPELDAYYGPNKYSIKHVVGIDCSEIHAANAGVRGDSELTWIGRAANHAAKLSALEPEYSTWITANVFNNLHETLKFGGPNSQAMWEWCTLPKMNNASIYRSTYWWRV